MPTKTFNLSERLLQTIAAEATKYGGNQSAGLEALLNRALNSSPDVLKQEALNNLRQGAAVLHDLDIPTDAIVSWVKQAAGSK